MKQITLTQGRFAVVDDEDYERINAFKWCFNHYASRAKGVTMHRMVLNAEPGQIVDHINGDKLDNRKSNLRFVSTSQNSMNSTKTTKETLSAFKGVSVQTNKHGTKRWRVVLKKDGKVYAGGSHISEVAAAEAYNRLAAELYGEYAALNVTDGVTDRVFDVRPRQPIRGANKFRGVSYDAARNKWVAQFSAGGVSTLRKRFDTEIEAAKAYDLAAIAAYGAQAVTNFDNLFRS